MRTLTVFTLAATSLLAACDIGTSGPGGDPPRSSHDLVFQGPVGIPLVVADSGGAATPLPIEQVTDPSPSPDGRWIAFVRVTGATESDIWVVRRDGTGLVRLTHAPGIDDQPAWSPDGTRLAFRSFRTGRMGDIWVMNADGTSPTNLTPDPLPGVTDERRPAWSPNGRYVAYAGTGGGTMDIWIHDMVSGQKSRLTGSGDYDTEPAFSPDGRHLVFRRLGGNGSDLVIQDLILGSLNRIQRAGEERLPAWSPDGTRIAYLWSVEAGSAASLEVIDVRTGATRRVAAGPADEPAWLRR